MKREEEERRESASLCCSKGRAGTERKNEMAKERKEREKEVKVCKYYGPQAARRLVGLLSSLNPRLHHLAGPL